MRSIAAETALILPAATAPAAAGPIVIARNARSKSVADKHILAPAE